MMFFSLSFFFGFRMFLKYFDILIGKRKNLCIFLFFCGKVVDMKWLVNVLINSSIKIIIKFFYVKNILNCLFIVLSFRLILIMILVKI